MIRSLDYIFTAIPIAKTYMTRIFALISVIRHEGYRMMAHDWRVVLICKGNYKIVGEHALVSGRDVVC